MSHRIKSYSVAGKHVTGDAIIKKVIGAEARAREEHQRLKALERERNELLDEFNSYRNARPVPKAPAKPRDGRADTVRVSFGDFHGMMHDPSAKAALLRDLKSLDPDEVVMLGDMLECGGWLAKHMTVGYVALTDYSYQEDVKATSQFIDDVQAACPDAVIHYTEGNHECLTPDHEVLTRAGWKLIADVSVTDVVAGLRDDGGVAWTSPERVHCYDYDGPLYRVNNRGFVASMTGNHRVPYYMKYGDKSRIRYQRADGITPGCGLDVPDTASTSGEPGPAATLSDDEIMLAAWLLTDGCISASVSLSQSKPATVEEIRALLGRLGLRFSERTRDRNITSICGRTLKSQMPSTEFTLLVDSARAAAALAGCPEWSNKTCGYVKKLPPWVMGLSDQRFSVFLDTVVRANGSRPTKRECSTAAVIYGRKEFLEGLQAACVVHGYRASLKPRTRDGEFSFWVLNVCKSTKIRVEGKDVEEAPYRGPVYCLTMPTGNFFTRLNGCVHVTGNSRVERTIVDLTMSHKCDGAFLMRAFSPQAALRLDERGIKYYRRSEIYGDGLPRGWVKLGKMHFTHELGASANAARQAVQKAAANVTFAHTHRDDQATIVFPGVGICKAFNPGCLCLCQPVWKHSDPTSWSQGYDIDFVAKSENFQRVHVPIWRGESLAGAMIERFKS